MPKKSRLLSILAAACMVFALISLPGCSDKTPVEPQLAARNIDIPVRAYLCSEPVYGFVYGPAFADETFGDSALVSITTSAGKTFQMHTKHSSAGSIGWFKDVPPGPTEISLQSRWTWPVYTQKFDLGESDRDTTVNFSVLIITSDPTTVTIGFTPPTTSEQELGVIEALNDRAARASKPLILGNLLRRDYGPMVTYRIPLTAGLVWS